MKLIHTRTSHTSVRIASMSRNYYHQMQTSSPMEEHWITRLKLHYKCVAKHLITNVWLFSENITRRFIRIWFSRDTQTVPTLLSSMPVQIESTRSFCGTNHVYRDHGCRFAWDMRLYARSVSPKDFLSSFPRPSTIRTENANMLKMPCSWSNNKIYRSRYDMTSVILKSLLPHHLLWMMIIQWTYFM